MFIVFFFIKNKKIYKIIQILQNVKIIYTKYKIRKYRIIQNTKNIQKIQKCKIIQNTKHIQKIQKIYKNIQKCTKLDKMQKT